MFLVDVTQTNLKVGSLAFFSLPCNVHDQLQCIAFGLFVLPSGLACEACMYMYTTNLHKRSADNLLGHCSPRAGGDQWCSPVLWCRHEGTWSNCRADLAKTPTSPQLPTLVFEAGDPFIGVSRSPVIYCRMPYTGAKTIEGCADTSCIFAKVSMFLNKNPVFSGAKVCARSVPALSLAAEWPPVIILCALIFSFDL